MLILGFGYRARSGKSTCCAAILHHASDLGVVAVEYSFGQEVLDYCIERALVRNVGRERLLPEELGMLQRAGADKRRDDENFWIVRLAHRIQRDRPQIALIPNCRFRNEVDWVRGTGGRYFRVTRLNENGTQFIASDRDPNHESETDLEFYPADYYLTAKTGQAALLAALAVTAFECIRSQKGNE